MPSIFCTTEKISPGAEQFCEHCAIRCEPCRFLFMRFLALQGMCIVHTNVIYAAYYYYYYYYGIAERIKYRYLVAYTIRTVYTPAGLQDFPRCCCKELQAKEEADTRAMLLYIYHDLILPGSTVPAPGHLGRRFPKLTNL